MTNVRKLKGKGSSEGKGAPPSIDDTPNNLEQPAREKPTAIEKKAVKEKMRPLQFSVPESLFNEFSHEAYDRIGPGRGAKVGLFLELWEADKKRRSTSANS